MATSAAVARPRRPVDDPGFLRCAQALVLYSASRRDHRGRLAGVSSQVLRCAGRRGVPGGIARHRKYTAQGRS